MKLFIKFINIKLSKLINLILNNIIIIINIFVLISLYMMLYLGAKLHYERQVFTLGGEFIIPPLIILISSFIKFIANNKIQGYKTLPVPIKRFTQSTLDEVTIDNRRVEEMLMYLNDLENWLEENGYLKYENDIL